MYNCWVKSVCSAGLEPQCLAASFQKAGRLALNWTTGRWASTGTTAPLQNNKTRFEKCCKRARGKACWEAIVVSAKFSCDPHFKDKRRRSSKVKVDSPPTSPTIPNQNPRVNSIFSFPFDLEPLDPRQTLYLKVEVGNLLGVQVEDPVQDLLEELGGLLLAQRLLLCQEVKELPAGHAAQEDRTRGRREEGKEVAKSEWLVGSKTATNPCLCEPSCCHQTCGGYSVNSCQPWEETSCSSENTN